MKIAFFDTHKFERPFFTEALEKSGNKHQITFLETRLTTETTALAEGFNAVCVFVNDNLKSEVVHALAEGGVRIVALRCAGFNNVDLEACKQADIKVVRVPAYSPHAVAEHALALILTLNRKIHRAYQRVHELNFSLDGLVGFDLNGKTVGVIGTGNIGAVFAKNMAGLGMKVLAYDPMPNAKLRDTKNVQYVDLGALYASSDIISLHVPLLAATRHFINEHSISQMKRGVMIVNTGRGALIDTQALVQGLKSGQIGSAGLDVYEEEEGVFFRDLSDEILNDDVLARLLTFPQVIVTSHQGFLTQEALSNIAQTTLENLTQFEMGKVLLNEVKPS